MYGVSKWKNNLCLPLIYISVWIINIEGANIDDYILPKTVIPKRYTLRMILEKDFYQTQTFKGIVAIEGSIKNVSQGQPIIVNGVDMTFAEVTVLDHANHILAVGTDIKENIILERFYITLDRAIDQDCQLVIKYTGRLQTDMTGLYLDHYQEANKTRWLVVAYLKPTYARKFFPCVDEPKYKATFQITVNHPEGYHAISNTKEIRRVKKRNKGGTTLREVSFAETPRMSTYHMSLVIGKFKSVYIILPYDIPYTIWAREELLEGVGYSTLMATPKAFDYLTKLTNCPYNVSRISKLEQVALPGFPHDEGSDGWGLPLYK